MRRRVVPSALAGMLVLAVLTGCSAAPGGSARDGARLQAAPTSAPADAGAPIATTLSASSGALVGGETVTVTGSRLSGVTAATFGGVAATQVTVLGPSRVTAVVPPAADFHPVEGDVRLFRGSQAVAEARPLTFSWNVETAADRELEYAFAHWTAATYNSGYRNFNAIGGDCQDFVSQSLLARGLPQSEAWFYRADGSHSASWGYAPAFDSYLQRTPSLGFTRLRADQRSELSIGDLAYFDWDGNGVPDHVMIVSGVSTVAGKTSVTLVGHNLDYDYRDLDITITHDHPGAHVWFYKVPASF